MSGNVLLGAVAIGIKDWVLALRKLRVLPASWTGREAPLCDNHHGVECTEVSGLSLPVGGQLVFPQGGTPEWLARIHRSQEVKKGTRGTADRGNSRCKGQNPK